MRGIAEFNFPAFEEATAQLRSRGYNVVSPAEEDLGRGFDPTGLTGHEDLSSIGFDLRKALIADLNHIAYECDAICLLPGWEFSKGAAAELALAEALGLRVGTLEDYLDDGTMTEREFLQGVYDEIHPDGPPAIWDKGDTDIMADALHVHSDDGRCLKSRSGHFCNVPTDHSGLFISPELANEVRITSSTGGQKGKKLARYDLIPVQPWWTVAELYGRGARKYEDRGWERGYDWSLSYAALMRHAQQFWDGEPLDEETHSPHLAAVVFHALALLEFSATHPEFDDRPRVTK